MLTGSRRGRSLSWSSNILLATLLVWCTLSTPAGEASGAGFTDMVLRVTPANFANDTFTLNDGRTRTVSSGLLIGLHFGGPTAIYQLTLARANLAKEFVLSITVSGANVRLMRRGGPFTNDSPSFRLTGVGSTLDPAIVTVSLRRGHASTPTSTSTSTTTTVASSTTTTTVP
jgi:hypothetical protein